MSTTRPISTSFPLGLFCNATMSIPANPPKAASVPVRKDDVIVEVSTTDLESDGLEDDLYWDEESA